MVQKVARDPDLDGFSGLLFLPLIDGLEGIFYQKKREITMKCEVLRFMVCCLIVGLISALTLGVAGCSKKTAAPMIPVTTTLSSIMVTPNPSANLTVNSVQKFTAIGKYSDGTTADITSDVTWSSSNPAIATIDSSGTVIGLAAGTVSITASLSGITSSPVSLTVILGAPND
jgi:hypothetical protein